MKGVSSFLTTMAIMVIIVAVVVGGSLLGVILSVMFTILILASVIWILVIGTKAGIEDYKQHKKEEKEEGP